MRRNVIRIVVAAHRMARSGRMQRNVWRGRGVIAVLSVPETSTALAPADCCMEALPLWWATLIVAASAHGEIDGAISFS
jgi:hypothetical protein